MGPNKSSCWQLLWAGAFVWTNTVLIMKVCACLLTFDYEKTESSIGFCCPQKTIVIIRSVNGYPTYSIVIPIRQMLRFDWFMTIQHKVMLDSDVGHIFLCHVTNQISPLEMLHFYWFNAMFVPKDADKI